MVVTVQAGLNSSSRPLGLAQSRRLTVLLLPGHSSQLVPVTACIPPAKRVLDLVTHLLQIAGHPNLTLDCGTGVSS